MNNGFIAQQNIDFEDQPKNLDSLRAEETNLMAIIDSCIRLANHPDWLVLKEKVFDGVVDSIRKRREIEIEKKPRNGPTIHNLNGQLEWAKKYSDLLTVASTYKQRLEQEQFAACITALGGKYACVVSVEEALAFVQDALRIPGC